MQCSLNASFFKNLIFQLQISEASFLERKSDPWSSTTLCEGGRRRYNGSKPPRTPRAGRPARCLTREGLARVLLPFVRPLAMRERDVPVLNHVLDLPLHGDAEEHDEVHHQDGPEHGHVERLEERADHGHQDALGGRVPKFKLREPPNERPELFVLFRW